MTQPRDRSTSTAILVTGSTGKVGRRLIPLTRRGVTVRAASRSPVTARPGVEPVHFDWTEESTYATARRGVRAMYQVPVRLVGGWQDLLLDQTMRQYEALHERGLDVTLTVGSWIHLQTVSGGRGQLAAAILDWLAEHLAGEPGTRKHQPVRIHLTGADEWRELPEWPPPSVELVHHLHPDGQLTSQPAADGTSSFVYDPADPTPTIGGPLIDRTAGVRDNRGLEARSDVLTFTTARLPEALDIIGTPVVELDHSRSSAQPQWEGRSPGSGCGTRATLYRIVRLLYRGCAVTARRVRGWQSEAGPERSTRKRSSTSPCGCSGTTASMARR